MCGIQKHQQYADIFPWCSACCQCLYSVVVFKGRIMNRFTKDMATIDDMLPLLMFDLVQVCSHDKLRTFCGKIWKNKQKKWSMTRAKLPILHETSSFLYTADPGGAGMYFGGVYHAAVHLPCSHALSHCLYCDEEILPALRPTAEADGDRRWEVTNM